MEWEGRAKSEYRFSRDAASKGPLKRLVGQEADD